MKPFNFDGLMAPVFTPFTDDGTFELNLSIIPTYLKYLETAGIKGILVNGTSGEGASQSVREREIVAEAWIQARGDEDSCLVVQVGGAPLPDVIRLAAHSESLGVDGIMCLPDLFYRPGDVDTLADYLAYVSAAAPNTPLLYYHLPSFTGVNLSMSALMERCVGGRVPTFVGLKFTSPDLQELGRCMEVCRRNPGTLRVFLGCDELMLPAFALGSPSSIATTFNIIPNISLELENHIKSGGSLEEAIELQRKISATVNSITRGGSWVPTMKAAMSVLTEVPVGPPRPPQQRVSEQHMQDMISDLKQILDF